MRKVFLLIFIILVVIGGITWFAYVRPKKIQNGEIPVTGFKSFFPLGNSDVPLNQVGTFDPQSNTSANTPASTNRFTQVINTPVAGFSTFTTKTVVTIPPATPTSKPTSQTVINHILRYVARGNGYIYEVKESGGVTDIPLQISNIFIPNIYEASFIDNNRTALLRFLRDDNRTIATYSVPIPDPNPDNTRTQREGIYLPENITSLAVHPAQSFLARLTLEQNSGVITTTTALNAAKKELLRTPVQEWIVSWPTPANVYIQTKAAATVEGFLYSIDPAGKKLTKIIGNVLGLTTSVSPSGTYILYSESTTNGFVTKILNTKTNTITGLSLAILPEKCTWLQNEDLICAGNTVVLDAVYPDSWYAGITHFSDQLYRIYTRVNTYDTLYDGQDQSFDIVSLAVNEDAQILYFIDKTTGILWKTSL